MHNSKFAVATPLVVPFVIAQLIACGDAVTSRSSTAATDGPLLGGSSNSGGTGIPDPAALQATATKWLMFNVWTDDFPRPPSNAVDHLNAVYNSEYVLTRDELPAFTP